MNWWKKRKLRKAQERYVYLKAVREAMERTHDTWDSKYNPICGREAVALERVERLMRE